MENVYELQRILEAGAGDVRSMDNPCCGKEFSLTALLRRVAHYVYSYFRDVLHTCYLIGAGVAADIAAAGSVGESTPNHGAYKQLILTELGVLLEPAKLAVAITACSLFVILAPLNSQEYAQNSALAAFTIALVRRANSASSFLTGSQRMMGTVLGAVFSFALYQGLQCEDSTARHSSCAPTVTIPVLMVWLGFCACFREGPQYGYAAIVSGFTPLVLFFESSVPTEGGAWLRVEMTIVGILIYLLIDNLIMPVRADEGLQHALLGCLHESRCALGTVVACLKLMVGVPNQRADVAIEQQIETAHGQGGLRPNSKGTGSAGPAVQTPEHSGGGGATTAAESVVDAVAPEAATADRVDMLLLHETRSRTARKMSCVSEDSNSSGTGAGDTFNPGVGESFSHYDGAPAGGGAGFAPATDETGGPYPRSFWSNIWTCEDTVDEIRVHLDRLRGKLTSATALLTLAPIEPHFFKG